METPKVTKTYREQHGLSCQGFSDAINENLRNTGMSDSMVSRVENGHYEPPLELLFECIATYIHKKEQIWIAHWAADSIAAMYPDLVESGIVQFRLPVAG